MDLDFILSYSYNKIPCSLLTWKLYSKETQFFMILDFQQANDQTFDLRTLIVLLTRTIIF